MADLSQKIALVTGASRGIGAATAKALAQAGALAVLVARTRADLEAVANEIIGSGGKAVVFPVDLSHGEQVQQVCRDIHQQVGVPDVLINNAGLGRWLFVEETPPEEAELMIKLPYLAAFWMCSYWIPFMEKKDSARIINVNSPISLFPWGGAAGYASSRWALRGLTQALTLDQHGSNVRVCHAVFGEVASNYWEANPGAEERIPRISKIIPVMSPEQVAHKLVRLSGNRRKSYTAPFLVWLFRGLMGIAPGLVKWVVRLTSYKKHFPSPR